MAKFKLKRIGELHRQLMLSPPEVRRRHADRLERLLLNLEPDRVYPYEFIYFRVTGFRPAENYMESYRGEELQPELHRSLERLTETVPQPADELEEPVRTIDELRGRFEVSRRTLHRWRRRGLVARKYEFPDGSVRIGVRESALEQFVEAHRDSLSFSGGFSRLSEREKAQIARRVERLRQTEDLSTTAAAGRVAEELDRAQETVRRAVKERQDRATEGSPNRLTSRAKHQIYAEYNRGAPVEELSQRYDRSRSSIYRVINSERARQLLRRNVTYINDEDFDSPHAEEAILEEGWRTLRRRMDSRAASDEAPLDAEEEVTVFRAYNYLKSRLAGLHEQVNPRRYVRTETLDRIEELTERIEQIERWLQRLYTPLVKRVARQHAGGGTPVAELTEEGTALLEKLIQSYDYRERSRFPAYLRLELQKAFARMLSAGADRSS